MKEAKFDFGANTLLLLLQHEGQRPGTSSAQDVHKQKKCLELNPTRFERMTFWKSRLRPLLETGIRHATAAPRVRTD